MKKITIINIPRDDIIHKSEIASEAENFVQEFSTKENPFFAYEIENILSNSVKKEVDYDSNIPDILLRNIAQFYVPILAELPVSYAARTIEKEHIIYTPTLGGVVGSLLRAAAKYGPKASKATIKYGPQALNMANATLDIKDRVYQPQPQLQPVYQPQLVYQPAAGGKVAKKVPVLAQAKTTNKPTIITLATDTLVKVKGDYYIRPKGEKVSVIGFELGTTNYNYFTRNFSYSDPLLSNKTLHNYFTGAYSMRSFLISDMLSTKYLLHDSLNKATISIDNDSLQEVLSNIKFNLQHFTSYAGAYKVKVFSNEYSKDLHKEHDKFNFSDKDIELEATYHQLNTLWFAKINKNAKLIKEETLRLEQKHLLELEQLKQRTIITRAAADSLMRDAYAKRRYKSNYTALTKAQKKVILDDIALQDREASIQNTMWNPIVNQLTTTGNLKYLYQLKPFIKNIGDYVKDKQGNIIMCSHKYESYTKDLEYIFKKYMGNNNAMGFSKFCRICGEKLDEFELEGVSRSYLADLSIHEDLTSSINSTVFAIVRNKIDTTMNKNQLTRTVTDIVSIPIMNAENRLRKDLSLTSEIQEAMLAFYITLYSYAFIVKLARTPSSGVKLNTKSTSPYEDIIIHVFTNQYYTVKKYNIDIKDEISKVIEELKKIAVKIESVKVLNKSFFIVNDPTYTYLYYIAKLANKSVKLDDAQKIIGKSPNTKNTYDDIPKVDLNKALSNGGKKQIYYDYIKLSYDNTYTFIKEFNKTIDQSQADHTILDKLRDIEKTLYSTKLELRSSSTKQYTPRDNSPVSYEITWSSKGKRQAWDKIIIQNTKTKSRKTFNKKDLQAGDVPTSWKVVDWMSDNNTVWSKVKTTKGTVPARDKGTVPARDKGTFSYKEEDLLKKYYKRHYPNKSLDKAKKIFKDEHKPDLLPSLNKPRIPYKKESKPWKDNTTKFSEFAKKYGINYYLWMNIGIQHVDYNTKDKAVLPSNTMRYLIVNSYYKDLLFHYSQLYNYKIIKKIVWINVLLEKAKNRDMAPLKHKMINVFDVQENRLNYIMNTIVEVCNEISKKDLGMAFVKWELQWMISQDKAFSTPTKINKAKLITQKNVETEDRGPQTDEVADENYNDNEEGAYANFDDAGVDYEEDSSDLFGF